MSSFNKWKKDKVSAERKSKFYGFLFRLGVIVAIIVVVYVQWLEKHFPIQTVPFIGNSFVAEYFSSYKNFNSPEVTVTVETPEVNVTVEPPVVAEPPKSGMIGDDAINGAKLVIIIYDNNKSTITYNQGSCDLNSSCNEYLQSVLKTQKLIK